MLRRVLGSLSVVGIMLGSLAALSQSGPSGRGMAPAVPRDLLASAFRVGIVPAPSGAPGRYVLEHRAAQALFSERGMDLRLSSRDARPGALGWSVVGARAVVPRAEKPLGGRLNRFEGARQTGERDVPTYGGVRYPGVLPGVDLWFEERAEGVEYGFRAERGEHLRRTWLEYAGVREVRVVEGGRALEIRLGEGVVREEGLHCEQETATGSRSTVGCRYADARRVDAERWRYAIEVEVEHPELPVVVDPVIDWSSYVGASEEDEFGDLLWSDQGVVYVTGSLGPNSEWKGDVLEQGLVVPGSRRLLVARFDEEGGSVRRTLVGGGAGDVSGRALALGTKHLFVAGETNAPGFGAITQNHGTQGLRDGFVARLDPESLAVDWIHVIDNEKDRRVTVHDLAVNSKDQLIVVGSTAGAPGTGSSDQDFLAVRIDPLSSERAGSRLWTTVVGEAQRQEVAYGVAVDDTGVFVTGMTESAVFPAVVRPHASPGVADAFVVRMLLDTGVVERSTYLGGRGRDEGRAMTFLDGSTLVVGGSTYSSGFPDLLSPATFWPSAFAAPLDTSSLTLDESRTRVVGGGGIDSEGRAVAVAPDGTLFLAGLTRSDSFPLSRAFDSDFGTSGLAEGFVMNVNLSGDLRPFASFVGGNQEDVVLAMRFDAQGRLYLGGETRSADLVPPGTPGQYPSPGGGSDLFVMRVDPNRDPSPDGGTPDAGAPDAGGSADAGAKPDGGGTEPDGGAGDAGGLEPDAGGTAPDAGPETLKSPLGFSCGATGGPGGLVLLVLAALAGRTRRARRHP